MRFFGKFTVTVAVLALLAEPVLAADGAGSKAGTISPLPAGKAAGVHQAQAIRSGLALIGVGGVVAIIALVATNNSGGKGPGQATPQFATATTAS
jgi:hypothetical protein